MNNYNDNDTIFLLSPVSFTFRADPGTTKLLRTEVLLDEQVITTTSEPSGTFSLGYPYLRTGTLTLRLQFITSSNSGSLADKLGMETVVVWREWVLIVDVDPPPAPVITHSVVNGYSVISWPGYTKANFVKYTVLAEYSHYLRAQRTFTDPSVTSWTDSSYAGGYSVQYYVTVETKVATRTSSISKNNIFDFTVTYDPADSTATIVLPPVVYSGTFNRFVIRENGIDRITVTDPLQTTQRLKIQSPGYQVTTELSVRYYHNSPDHPIVAASKAILTEIPAQRIPRRATKYYYNATLQQIVGFWSSGSTARLIRMDPNTLQPIDSVTIYNGPSYHVPYEGEYAYFSRPKDLVKVNLVTHQETSFPAITSTFGSGPSVITGASNELVSYAWFGPNPAGPGVIYYERVLNTLTGTEIYYLTGTVSPTPVISSFGTFLRATNNKIYKINGTTTTEVGVFSGLGLWRGFREDQPDEIFVASSTMQIYDANTMTLKRSISAPGGFVKYDTPKKKMVFSEYGKVHTVDINTLELKTYNIIDFDAVIINGLLLTSNGNFIRLY
ncbi:MAG: hypothetical protein JNN04_11610 [Cyclobacteriaceae bacterium]|nr:hypothetical protein [Cyclobacteriaceae bacterium]